MFLFYYFSFDWIGYGLILLGVVITLAAQFYINSRYKKYRAIENKNHLTGVEVARKILDANGLDDVYVTEVSGFLSDHYDPSRKVIRLSKDNFNGTSIASASVAAHECGHAIQDKEGYVFLRIRGALVPFVNLASSFGYIATLIGFLFNMLNLAWIGVGLELVILFFQLITLPVEFNASSRAEQQLLKLNLLSNQELDGTKDMLRSAAMTYVASLATTLLEILRLVLILFRSDDR